MSDNDPDRTASLMTPAKLAQLKVRPPGNASPAAWLDQLAADAGSAHVRRLAELRGQLEAQVRERSGTGLGGALQGLHDALGQLDFSLVQPRGWLARATGQGKEAAAGFSGQIGRVHLAGEDLADTVRALMKKHQAQSAAAERILLEYEAEVRAMEKIMEQGARWLQDMRNQLKARQAAGGDAAVQQSLREDSARCELLVTRLKQLRNASAAAQQAAERVKTTARSRASVLASVQQVVEDKWKAWQGAVAPVAEQVGASGAATQGVESARSAHASLQSALRHAGKDCSGLATQERALAEELAALQAPLQAAT